MDEIGFSGGEGEGKVRNEMKKIFSLALTLIFFVSPGLTGCAKKGSEESTVPKVGPVKLNPHPSSLEGKTIVLRWNGKYNGDHFLSDVAERLTKQVKDLKVIRMWEADKTTAAISDSLKKSKEFSEKVAGFKPALVIASQAD